MGCRDMEKCEAAAKEIRGNTLNPNVYARQLDLASVKSIREFVDRIKQGEKTKTYHLLTLMLCLQLCVLLIEIKHIRNSFFEYYLLLCRGAACGYTNKQCRSHEMSSMENRRWLRHAVWS